MREAKERQKAIMAKFAAQQKKVMEQLEQQTGEKEDKGKEKDMDKGSTPSTFEGTESKEGEEVCVFCREGDSPDNPLCLVAFIQRSNRIAHAKDQSCSVWKRHFRKRYGHDTEKPEEWPERHAKRRKETDIVSDLMNEGNAEEEGKEEEEEEDQDAQGLEESMESMEVESRDDDGDASEDDEEEFRHTLEDAQRLAEAAGEEDEGQEDENAETEGDEHGYSEEDAEEIRFGDTDRVDELIAEEGLEDEEVLLLPASRRCFTAHALTQGLLSQDEDEEAEEYDETIEEEGDLDQVQNAVMQLIEDLNRQRDQLRNVEQDALDAAGESSATSEGAPSTDSAKTAEKKQFVLQWLGALQDIKEVTAAFLYSPFHFVLTT